MVARGRRGRPPRFPTWRNTWQRLPGECRLGGPRGGGGARSSTQSQTDNRIRGWTRSSGRRAGSARRTLGRGRSRSTGRALELLMGFASRAARCSGSARRACGEWPCARSATAQTCAPEGRCEGILGRQAAGERRSRLRPDLRARGLGRDDGGAHPADQKDRVGHRGRAFRALRDMLR